MLNRVKLRDGTALEEPYAMKSTSGPSPIRFNTLRFTDIDQYRQAVRLLQIDFIPLSRVISAAQKTLSLPGCYVQLIDSFPRLVDAQLASNCTFVGLTMDDRTSMRFNTAENDRPTLAIGHGQSGYKQIETASSRFASVIFTPEIRDRGWPESRKDFTTVFTSDRAFSRLRLLISSIFESGNDDSASRTLGAALGIKESLLGAIDSAFADINPKMEIRRPHLSRHFSIIQDIDSLFAINTQAPLYSDDLAEKLGVSIRTIHNAVKLYRGMSLHRYLRLKRLWLVRQNLMAGGQSVKACALAYGFWHLGDFARAYRELFDESPSETLSKVRS